MFKEFETGKEPLITPESKILTYLQAVKKIREYRENGLTVILAQGVFDIVHIGHVEYIREAKKAGGLLFVGIENDETVHLNKGQNRPVNSLNARLKFLSEFQSIDYVFGYEDVPSYKDGADIFTKRFKELNPTAIAITSWDPTLDLKKMQADIANIGVVITYDSKIITSSEILKMIGYE